MRASRLHIPGILLVALGLAAVGTGCKKAEREAYEAKCDASLRLRAESLVKSAPDSLLEVLGHTTGPIDDARRHKLEDAGARLATVQQDMFTGRIPVNRLGKVAVLDFVASLALAQTREPLGH